MELTGPKPTGTSRQSKPVTERRQNVRLRVHSPAYASLNESSAKAARDLNEILDISENGMSIQTSSPLEADRALDLSLDLSETSANIRTSGQVVWSDSSGRAGIRFPRLPSQSLRQLKQWLFANVLTAFDHAGEPATLKDTDKDKDASGDTSNGNHPSLNMRHNEASSEPPKSSGQGGILAAVKNMQRDVESGAYDRETALQLIAEQALAFTRAGGAAIALSQGDSMVCMASAGSDAPPVGTPLDVGSGFSGECVRTGRSLRCDDSESDDRVNRQGCRVLGIRSMVAVPIRQGHRVAGLLEVFAAQPYAFNGQDISVLQQLAGTILSAMGAAVEIPPSLPDASHVPPAAAQPSPLQPARVPPPRVKPARIQPERFEAQPSSDVLSATVAASTLAPRPRFHKILLAAAGITFLFALLWLVAPSVASWFSPSTASAPAAQPPKPAKARNQIAEASDLDALRKLAEQGDPAAQFALGARYATGEQVKQDYSEAVRWFTQAADRGHILAQATLGAYYWAGRGVQPDLTKAYFWSALAQAGGDQASKYRVAVLTSRMSRSEILSAQQQANEWLHNHPAAGGASSSQ